MGRKHFVTFATATTTALAAALAMSPVGMPTAEALPPSSDGTTAAVAPLAGIYRACDHSQVNYVSPTGSGSAHARINAASNQVTADVTLAIGKPGTTYSVRLIQMPRPSSLPCNAGDPGVASGVLIADVAGTGHVTLTDEIRPGATGAWVFIMGPPDPGQVFGEFYTSDIVTAIA